jgi:histone acetyltransferase 1
MYIYTISAIDAIRIHLIGSDNSLKFAPDFAHQMFGDMEVIVGYSNLHIDLKYHSSTLESFTDIRYNLKKKVIKIEAMERERENEDAGNNGDEGEGVKTIDCDDLKACLSLCTPPCTTYSREEFDKLVKDRSLSAYTPPGDLYKSIDIVSDDGDCKTFDVYIGAPYKDARLREVQCRAETLSFFYIDAASTADFTDTRWRLLHLYQRGVRDVEGKIISNPLFAGFITLFEFHNPLRFDRPVSSRICQLLVLPPYQRKGLGKELIKCAYSVAQDLNSFEVTVEDPADGFKKLRDVIDLEVCVCVCMYVCIFIYMYVYYRM